MNFNRDREFEESMDDLIKLLKKILRNLPGEGAIPPFCGFKDKDPQIQVCFFNFFSISPEEFEEMEDAYEEALGLERKADEGPLELSAADREFLRRHGIRF